MSQYLYNHKEVSVNDKLPIHKHLKAFLQRSLARYIYDHSISEAECAEAISAYTGIDINEDCIVGFVTRTNNINPVVINNIRRFLTDVYPDLGIENFTRSSDPTKAIAITTQACFDQYPNSVDTDLQTITGGVKLKMDPIAALHEVEELTFLYQTSDLYQCDLKIKLQQILDETGNCRCQLQGQVIRHGHRFHGYLIDQHIDCVFFLLAERNGPMWIVMLRQVLGERNFDHTEFGCRLTLE